ncbi:right-handed parallel beta-helix repeat-containing protein, partial [candidate division WOR-3 bacterium]|nr:right-handed parallel beta-helix repeat-containing protein [candidate division WOR-3 bacterium]
TIIDGNSAGIVIRIETGVDTTTIISGFTIQNGFSTYSGGIRCYNNSSPTISGNIITQNTTTSGGGGILCRFNSSPTISGNIITQNTATWGAGIFCWVNSSPAIIDNVITGNISSVASGGIGLYDNCSPTISDNVITGNEATEGAGIAIRRQCSYTIRHNIITNNTGGAGIWSDSSSSGLIDSCTISNNTGDGVYCGASGEPEIHYCNITYNGGYAIRNTDPSVTVNADSNWWGDSTGPYHPTANPGGLGDTVSDYVDFDPWATGPFPWGIEEHEPSQSITTFLQISPNPFSDRVNIKFNMEHSAEVIELKIYDATGRLVRQWGHTTMRLSDHISWDGTDHANRKLPSGVYFLKFQAGDYTATEKLLMIR